MKVEQNTSNRCVTINVIYNPIHYNNYIFLWFVLLKFSDWQQCAFLPLTSLLEMGPHSHCRSYARLLLEQNYFYLVSDTALKDADFIKYILNYLPYCTARRHLDPCYKKYKTKAGWRSFFPCHDLKTTKQLLSPGVPNQLVSRIHFISSFPTDRNVWEGYWEG